VTFVVVSEEAMRFANIGAIKAWIDAQPPWSDLPFIVLTQRGGGPDSNPTAARLADAFGNVSFLERPFHATTFASLARTAVKARKRQYEARDRLEELAEARERLEQRVAERTAELERSHAKVLEEIRQRERVEDQLRQAQKMEVIGQLTGGIAHDFNNLLMAVLSNLDLLRKHVPQDSRVLRLIDGALQGAKRGAALTQRLLAFARRQSLDIRPSSLVALVEGMRDLLEKSVGSNIELRFSLTSDTPLAVVDLNQVELALLNLVVNARDAMPGGGVVTVGVDRMTVSGDGDLKAGDYVRLYVRDTGVGMNDETLARAIEPFFSTKELGKGTGLGLSMVHGLAVQLNGALRLSSKPGKGTTAELFFPASQQAAESAPAEVPESAAHSAISRAKVLLVDDDPLIAMSSVDMLEDLGHEVIEANSAQAALDALIQNPDINILITDFAMPGMNGAQLAQAARKISPGLPILLATGYAEIPQGADIDLPRLGKPYSQHQLSKEITKLLAMRPSEKSPTGMPQSSESMKSL